MNSGFIKIGGLNLTSIPSLDKKNDIFVLHILPFQY